MNHLVPLPVPMATPGGDEVGAEKVCEAPQCGPAPKRNVKDKGSKEECECSLAQPVDLEGCLKEHAAS